MFAIQLTLTRRLASGLMALLTVAAAITVLTPPAAAAASGEVEVSENGKTFGSTYPGVLFDDIALLVPGDSQQQVFYVRNSGTEAGFLRVTLKDVAFSDTDFANALTVTARTAGSTGNPASLLSAKPCWVLFEGQAVAAGAIVPVTAGLALGELHGMAGQGATANLAIGVELSDTTAGSLPPTACGSPSAEIPVAAGPARPPGTGPQAQSGSGFDVGASETEPGSPAGAGGDLPVLGLPGGVVIDPNTWQLFEELLVLVLVGAAALGYGWFVMVARSRRRRKADEESEVVA